MVFVWIISSHTHVCATLAGLVRAVRSILMSVHLNPARMVVSVWIESMGINVLVTPDILAKSVNIQLMTVHQNLARTVVPASMNWMASHANADLAL